MRFNTYINGSYGFSGIDLSGGMMTLPLKLQNPPTGPLDAVSRGYVDTAASSFTGASVTGVFSAARLPAYSGADVSSTGGGVFLLSNTGVTVGSHAKVTVNNKGRVTSGGVLVSADVPDLSYTKLVDLPTTLAGYGITDVVSLNGGTMTGSLTLNAVASNGTHLVNKSYVDTRVGGSGGSAFVIGDIVSKSSGTTPSGFLRCNGGVVNRATYANLFSAIGTSYNKGASPNSTGRPWVMQYDFNTTQTSDITGWTQADFNVGNSYAGNQLAVFDSIVFQIGGETSSNSGQKVVATNIESNGTILNYATWGGFHSLPQSFTNSHIVVTSSRLYLVGGNAGGMLSSVVYQSTLSAEKPTFPWSNATPLPATLAFSQVIITSSRVYTLGGIVNGNWSSAVYTAPINGDGTFGAWATGISLPVTLVYSHSVVLNNRVYLLGGQTGGTDSSAVLTCPINSDGTLGTWAFGTALPLPVTRSTVVVTRNRVYLLGGIINGSRSSVVYTAPITAQGEIGTWVTGTSLPAAISDSNAIVTKSRIYLMGGVVGAGGVGSGNAWYGVYQASFLGGFNNYTTYTANSTTDNTVFTLPDLTLKDAPGFVSYIKF